MQVFVVAQIALSAWMTDGGQETGQVSIILVKNSSPLHIPKGVRLKPTRRTVRMAIVLDLIMTVLETFSWSKLTKSRFGDITLLTHGSLVYRDSIPHDGRNQSFKTG